jgi:prepilin-type N-terminal cleavage/methylation domain-containing protein
MNRIGNYFEKHTQRHGFTLVEVVVSLLIVSVMLVAGLNMVGGARLSQFKTSRTSRGQALAESLMAEILQQDYSDPNDTPVFGIESGEASTTRADFDDVDDYHDWNAQPPQYKDGSAIADFTEYQRHVKIEWVDPMNPSQVEASESNAKRVTVTVTVQDMPVAILVAIRTAWE